LATPEVFANNEVKAAVWELARRGRLSHNAVDDARSTNFRAAASHHLAECRDIGLQCHIPAQLATATASPACRVALLRAMSPPFLHATNASLTMRALMNKNTWILYGT